MRLDSTRLTWRGPRMLDMVLDHGGCCFGRFWLVVLEMFAWRPMVSPQVDCRFLGETAVQAGGMLDGSKLTHKGAACHVPQPCVKSFRVLSGRSSRGVAGQRRVTAT